MHLQPMTIHHLRPNASICDMRACALVSNNTLKGKAPHF